MLEALAIAEGRGNGLIHYADLAELGVTSRQVRRALGEGYLIRVHRGVYARPPHHDLSQARDLHRLQVRATYSLAGPDSIVSHLSAAAMHGLPLIGRWPDRVHVSRVDAEGGSSSPGIVSHRTDDVPDMVMIDGVVVTSIIRTLVDVACTSSFAVGVAMTDFALRFCGVTVDELLNELERVSPVYGRKVARRAFEFADGRSGSPGESLSRVQAHLLGYAPPELQVHVTTVKGEFDVDFGWPGAHRFGEFDGLVKYTRDAYLKGRTIQEVVVEEKEREDAIRAKTGSSFVRWLWKDALSPALFARILGEAGIPRLRGRG